MAEPRAPAPTGPLCRNCGRPTGERFCGHCGQAVDDRRRPLRQLAGEFLADWLSLDSRLARSLAALPRPGRLTLLYLDGKRVTYLRPLRLYLLASLALFSTVLTLDPFDARKVNLYIGDELVSKAPPDGPQSNIQIINKDSFFGRRIATRGAEKVERLKERPPQELLDSLFRYMRRYLPAALILFVPFLAAGLKLLYWRTRTLYLDHLVFALHFQSALFLSLAITWLVGRAVGLELGIGLVAYAGVAVLMMTVYLGIALSRVHHQRWWWTVGKTVLLLYIYSQLLSLTVGVAVWAAIWQA